MRYTHNDSDTLRHTLRERENNALRDTHIERHIQRYRDRQTGGTHTVRKRNLNKDSETHIHRLRETHKHREKDTH